MTTINQTHPDPQMNAPPTAEMPGAFTNANAGALVTIFFRQSADGVNFVVTPAYLAPLDATVACNSHPCEWSRDGVTFAPWKVGHDNSTQTPGGRGRLQGHGVAAR